MNADTMLSVLLSSLFFAPLLIGLVFFLFIGVLVAFEGVLSLAGAYAAQSARPTPQAAAERTGPIGAELQDAVREEVVSAQEAGEPRPVDKVQNG